MCSGANPAVLSNSPLWGRFLTENGGPLVNLARRRHHVIGILIMLAIGNADRPYQRNLIAKLNMPRSWSRDRADVLFGACDLH
jgi:hypothetical protein